MKDVKDIINDRRKICNMCGGSCMKLPYDGAESMDFYGLETLITGGFCSTELRDLSRYVFVMCEECIVKLFHSFKIPPRVDHVDIHGCVERSTTWEDDRRERQEHIDKYER